MAASTRKRYFGVLTAVALLFTVLMPLTAAAQAGSPHFNVDYFNGQIWGHEWPMNTELIVTLEGTEIGRPMSDDFGDFHFDFDSAGVGPDFQFTVSDGTTTKEHIVTDLAITVVDPITDTVTGFAEDGTVIDIWVDETPAHRTETASAGTWTADFGVAGDEPHETDTADIVAGSSGAAMQCDGDGDCTFDHWGVPNPQVNVDPHSGDIWGHQWIGESSVDVSINGDVLETVGTDSEGNWGTWTDPANLAAGVTVQATQGTTTKSHVILNLVVTGVDPVADTVSGTATAGSELEVWINDSDGWRHEVAAGDGTWTADFSTPGGEEGEETTYDLDVGTNGGSAQCDVDGDCTFSHWGIALPHFNVSPEDGGIWGHQWPADGTVEIFLEGGSIGTFPVDEFGDFNTGVDPSTFAPEFHFEVTDGTATKDHVVTHLTITMIDVDSDMVFGTAQPFTEVDVWSHESDAWRHVGVDEFGDWSADFSTPGDEEGEEATLDILDDSQGDASQCDDDGDCTFAHWTMEAPPGFIEGHVLLDGSPLTDVEVFLSLDGQFTCTDADGYFSFHDVPTDSDGFVATGPASATECGNAAFLDPDGKPLLVAVASDFDLSDSYEYIELNVDRAGSASYVRVFDVTGGADEPVDGVHVRMFDRNNPDFVASYGHNPDPADYPTIFMDGLGLMHWGVTGSSFHEDPGTVEGRYPITTDILVLVELAQIEGLEVEDSAFADRGDGVFLGPDLRFEIDYLAMVEGHVYLDGDPLPDVQVWLSHEGAYACTDADGYFSFVDVVPVGDTFMATGPSVAPGCANAQFIAPDGIPMLVEGFGGINLADGYEYVEFHVRRAAAIQTVMAYDISSGAPVPVDDVLIRTFDRNDQEFMDHFGHEPDPADYWMVWDYGIGEHSWWTWTGSTVGDEPGTTMVRYEYPTDVLVLGEFESILGALAGVDEFVDRGDGLLVGPDVVFEVGEPPSVVVDVHDLAMEEGDHRNRGRVTFELSEPQDHSIFVSYEVVEGTATSGEDFRIRNRIVKFRPGQTIRTMPFIVLGDTTVEPDEWFEIVIAGVEGAEPGSSGIVTLLNDDEEVTLPVISIEDAEVIEGDRRRNRVTIHLTLSEPAPELVRIQLTTVEGTATPVEDYVPLTRWRRILPGNDSATFMIRIIGDRIPEPDEFFTVRIIDAEGAVIGTDTATVTIINDD